MTFKPVKRYMTYAGWAIDHCDQVSLKSVQTTFGWQKNQWKTEHRCISCVCVDKERTKQKRVRNKTLPFYAGRVKKKVLPSFYNFSLFHFHFPPSLYWFSFLIHFLFFPCLSFPDRSSKISRSEVSTPLLYLTFHFFKKSHNFKNK